MARPKRIALIGIDGAGKTTQAKLLVKWLEEGGVRAVYCKNAGGKLTIGRIARRLGRADHVALLGRDGYLAVELTLRWMAIARGLLRSRVSGRVAVMDRYSYCQYVTIRARADRGERFARLIYSVFPAPDVVCFLAVSPENAHERILRRGYDAEELRYLSAVDTAYRSLPELSRFAVIDADAPADQVTDAVRSAVTPAVTEPCSPRREPGSRTSAR